jgi:hypothetical protein
MSLRPNPRFALQSIKVPHGGEDEAGVLVFVDDRLVAILVRLDAPFYDEAQGRWNLEIGFDRCAGTPSPFERLSGGLAWVAQRLGLTSSELDDELLAADHAFSTGAASATGGQ